MPPTLRPSNDAAGAIAAAVEAFLARQRVTQVYIAGSAAPPPPLAYHVHFPRLSVTLQGTDAMHIEQDSQPVLIRARRGEAVLVPANCWNRPQWSHPALVLNILFGRKQLGISLVVQRGRGRAPTSASKANLQGPLEGALKDMLRALLGLTGRATAAAPGLVEAILHTAVQLLRTADSTHGRRAATFYEAVCMYVQEHFQSPLSRSSVAEHFRVSPNHISRLFKQHGMATYNDYVTYVRIDRAKFLLGRHPQTVDEVAAATGFSETSYFCRVFKRHTKRTPTQYRLEHLEAQREKSPSPASKGREGSGTP